MSIARKKSVKVAQRMMVDPSKKEVVPFSKFNNIQVINNQMNDYYSNQTEKMNNLGGRQNKLKLTFEPESLKR